MQFFSYFNLIQLFNTQSCKNNYYNYILSHNKKHIPESCSMMIAVDLGNKYTTVYDGQNLMTLPTTILINGQGYYQIGLDRGHKNVLYDLIMTLGVKYQDQQFIRYAKFYPHDFAKNSWGKIDIVLSAGFGTSVKFRKITAQTVLALYLRKFLNMFRYKFYENKFKNLQKFLDSYKFYISVSGVSDHPYRYALKQVCQIVGIQPIFLNSPHAAISDYYHKQKKNIKQHQLYSVIQFGDKGITCSLYRLQSYQQKIIQVIQYKSLKKGGYHLTKTLSEYFVDKIKQEKGVDINRHGPYMGLLHCQCQNVKINVIQSQEKQGYVRVPDLPDQSTFGKSVNQKMIYQILEKDISQIVKFVEEILQRYSEIKQVLILGGSAKMPIFQEKIKKIVTKIKRKNNEKQIKIVKLKKQSVVEGIFALQKQEIVLFDISESQYEVTGQENFHKKLMSNKQDLPERRDIPAKFPAGQLQFNLRVSENGNKIAHFLLQARPTQSQFFLNFEINRNKLIWLFVRTQKGKIELIPNFQALTTDQINKQIDIIKQIQSL